MLHPPLTSISNYMFTFLVEITGDSVETVVREENDKEETQEDQLLGTMIIF